MYGVALLWQPEMVYVYLAVIEQYTSCSEAVEAAAGAVQNLTACNWKVSLLDKSLVDCFPPPPSLHPYRFGMG